MVTLYSVPGEPPRNVRGQSGSSTSVLVEWDLPRQKVLYGILRGFRIRYVVAKNSNNMSNTLELVSEQHSFYVTQNLKEFTNYNVEVAAVTVGEGPYSTPIIVITDQDSCILQFVCRALTAGFTCSEPGEVPQPPPVDERNLTPFSAVVRWNPPTNPNGVILHYTVNFVAVSSTPSQSTGRQKRQVGGVRVECILGGQMNINRNMTCDGTQTTVTLTELSEYALFYNIMTQSPISHCQEKADETLSNVQIYTQSCRLP